MKCGLRPTCVLARRHAAEIAVPAAFQPGTDVTVPRSAAHDLGGFAWYTHKPAYRRDSCSGQAKTSQLCGAHDRRWFYALDKARDMRIAWNDLGGRLQGAFSTSSGGNWWEIGL